MLNAEPDPYADGRSSKGCARLGIGTFLAGCGVSVAGMVHVLLTFWVPETPADRMGAGIAIALVGLFSLAMGICAAVGLRSRALAGVPRWLVAAAWTFAALALALPVVAWSMVVSAPR